jgi:hypothetical protein
MPSDSRKKIKLYKLYKRYHQAVKGVLLREWDPIGVGRLGGPEDEYDSYVPVVCGLLMTRRTKREIFDYLWTLETQHMGMPGNRLATEHLAERLLRIPQEIENASST